MREPITNLLSMLVLLDNHPVEDDNLKQLLNDFKTTTRLINTIIDDLIDTLLIRDHKPSLNEQEEIQIGDVFENMLEQSKYLIEENKAHIGYDFQQAPSIVFSREYMESILMNLLTNTLKFRSPSRTPKISVTTRHVGDHVLLKFQDNGTGLDIEKHEDKLFGFYQKFHDHSNGKGLGLFLIKSQVEVFGGDIELKSKEGEGMKVLVRFPKKP